jgi:hypothetical protein
MLSGVSDSLANYILFMSLVLEKAQLELESLEEPAPESREAFQVPVPESEDDEPRPKERHSTDTPGKLECLSY